MPRPEYSVEDQKVATRRVGMIVLSLISFPLVYLGVVFHNHIEDFVSGLVTKFHA